MSSIFIHNYEKKDKKISFGTFGTLDHRFYIHFIYF